MATNGWVTPTSTALKITSAFDFYMLNIHTHNKQQWSVSQSNMKRTEAHITSTVRIFLHLRLCDLGEEMCKN